jgi:hypothetical protein
MASFYVQVFKKEQAIIRLSKTMRCLAQPPKGAWRLEPRIQQSVSIKKTERHLYPTRIG